MIASLDESGRSSTLRVVRRGSRHFPKVGVSQRHPAPCSLKLVSPNFDLRPDSPSVSRRRDPMSASPAGALNGSPQAPAERAEACTFESTSQPHHRPRSHSHGPSVIFPCRIQFVPEGSEASGPARDRTTAAPQGLGGQVGFQSSSRKPSGLSSEKGSFSPSPSVRSGVWRL